MTTDAPSPAGPSGRCGSAPSRGPLAFGATVAASAKTYVTSFPTEASRHQLAVITGTDTGLAVLLGPVSAIGTVGGYTVYKGFVFLTTIGAIWALFAATRAAARRKTPGAGNCCWPGARRPARATAATLGALGAAVAIVFAGTTLAHVARRPGQGRGLRRGRDRALRVEHHDRTAVFAAVGAVTSQLGRTRRVATGLGMGVFGVMLRGPDDRRLRPAPAGCCG